MTKSTQFTLLYDQINTIYFTLRPNWLNLHCLVHSQWSNAHCLLHSMIKYTVSSSFSLHFFSTCTLVAICLSSSFSLLFSRAHIFLQILFTVSYNVLYISEIRSQWYAWDITNLTCTKCKFQHSYIRQVFYRLYW